MKDENNELKRSLTFMQNELEEVRKVVREQGGKLNQVTNMDDLSERLRKQEDYSRRQNVVIEGLAESEGESEEKLQVSVQALLKDKMNITPDIEIIHRIGKASQQRPRPVIMKLKTYKDRQDCLKFSARLKGTNIFVNEDVSKATMDVRRSKMDELMDKRRQGYIAYFSGTTIITKRRGQQDDRSSPLASDGFKVSREPAVETRKLRANTQNISKKKQSHTDKRNSSKK